MRWPLLVLAALGCCIPPSSGGGTGGADAGNTCSNASTCADCVACALEGPCATLYASCQNSAECSGLDQCYDICDSDSTCRQQCVDSNPGGVSAFTAVRQCVYCTSCPSDCPGQCS